MGAIQTLQSVGNKHWAMVGDVTQSVVSLTLVVPIVCQLLAAQHHCSWEGSHCDAVVHHKVDATDEYYEGCLNPTDEWTTWQKTVSFLLSASLFFLGGPFPKGDMEKTASICLRAQSSGSISSNFAPSNTNTCLCSVLKVCHKHLLFQAMTFKSSSTTLTLFQAL